jgi:hypothetical protein
MKRLAFALIFSAAFASSAFAVTQTERERNSFAYVSATSPVVAGRQAITGTTEQQANSTGYNKAVEEHKNQKETTTHKKHGKKAAAKHTGKKHSKKKAAAPAAAPAAEAPKQ